MRKSLDGKDDGMWFVFAGWMFITLLGFGLATAEYLMSRYHKWKKAEARKEIVKDSQFAPYTATRP